MPPIDRGGRGSDRGQTEVLGYALLFGALMIVLALVVTLGYANLVDARDHERVTNVERGFETLAANVDAVVRNDAPSRSTELALADGRLVTRSETAVTIKSGGGGTTPLLDRTLTALVYESGDGERVVYEGGAVFRADEYGAAMLRPPAVAELNESSVILPVVQLDGTERVGVSGKEAVSLRTERDPGASRVVVVQSGTDRSLTINITSPRADAWAQYLERQPAVSSCSVPDGTATCTLEADRIAVVYVEVDVDSDA